MRQEANHTLPYPAELLIPHRPPMLLVRQLLERQENFAAIDAVIDHNSPFIDNTFGILPELYVELIAQATAVVSGWDALKESKPPVKGFLVGLNNVVYKNKLKIGKEVLVEITKDFEFGEVTIMKGVLLDGDKIVLEGEIKVWEDKSGEAINIL